LDKDRISDEISFSGLLEKVCELYIKKPWVVNFFIDANQKNFLKFGSPGFVQALPNVLFKSWFSTGQDNLLVWKQGFVK
jgi:hypothetical protein